jgi:hypothetical protein
MYKPRPADNPAVPEFTRQRLPAPIPSPLRAEDQTHAGSSRVEFGTTIYFVAGVGFEAIDSQFSIPVSTSL